MSLWPTAGRLRAVTSGASQVSGVGCSGWPQGGLSHLLAGPARQSRGSSSLTWLLPRARESTRPHTCPGGPSQRQERKARPGPHRMGPLVSSVPPALWVPGCLALLLWLWVLCAACHRKRVQRQPAGLQGSVMPTATSTLTQPRLGTLGTLSKSDTRLHEVHRGPRQAALRPASMDLLGPQCLEVSRGTIRPPAAFSHRELPQTSPATTDAQPSVGPEATYSNVGLAAIPRASLAASPVVWAGARLTSSWARPGPEARPELAEYARIHKLKGADQGPQGLEQGRAQGIPATQVDILYSRVNKPKRRDPGPAADPLDPKGRAEILAPGRSLSYEALPLRGLSADHADNGVLENVYESIQEVGLSRRLAAPSSSP
ncbi:lck-interacting transmembrane adapter 1 isoform X2 [Phyllostomus hastatus]|uniref:lck-interacting transmembrane adapter 1 isoform X2 n=1 Tax=Phyllostomus hastatus TaxID=9423 RepID=UPI001E6820BD|nr:lck-interacting transmembrane adapter 1 isoform X2 [Phyllostomus hastatus]